MLRLQISATVFLAAALALTSLDARADNPDRFYMSSDAALQAGAITADTRDTGSVWYNPAGLARAKGTRFDVNVSAYALQLGGVPKLEAAGEGSKAQTVSVVNFASVPTAFASLHKLRNLTVGVGVFVPQMGVSGLRTKVTQPRTDQQIGIEFDVNNYRTTQELFGGPGVGWHVAPGVDFGMALFLHYRAILDTQEARILLRQSESRTDVIAGHSLTDWLQLGLAPSLGVQVQIAPRWRYGMTLRLPSVRLLQLLGYSETFTGIVDGQTVDEANFKDEASVKTRVLTPARMNAGLSYSLDKTRLALEASYQLPYRNSEVSETLRPTINGRFGARRQVKPNMEIGGGVFSNMATTKELKSLGDSKINFYGITLALQTGVEYKILEKEGHQVPQTKKMQFGSSFAFSYAIGLGQTLRGVAGSVDNPAEFYRQEATRVTAHEWTLSVGGSLFEN